MRSLAEESRPCTGRADLYDIVLFDDAPATERTQAVHQAAALCATCTAPCDQKVTVSTTPVELVLLEPGWMPPTHEGRPEQKPKAGGWRVPNRQTISLGRDYVRPNQRVAVWARMAAERAAMGHKLGDIAVELCVSEDTAAELIRINQQATRGVA